MNIDLVKSGGEPGHGAASMRNGGDHDHRAQLLVLKVSIALQESLGTIEGKKVVYVGDGNNIVHSWLRLAACLPFHFVCCCPEGYTPDQDTTDLVSRSGALEPCIAA